MTRHSPLLLTASSLAVGVLNYGYSLALVHRLPPAEFARFSSLSSLLLVIGTAAGAAVPWVLARQVAATAPGSPGRKDSVRFALRATAVLGLAGCAGVLALSASYASGAVRLAAAAATLAVFACSVPAGYLQGQGRLAALSAYRLGEAVVKVVVGVLLVVAGTGAAGAVGGFVAGAAACTAVGAWGMRPDLGRVPRSWASPLWRETVGLGAVQVLVALVSTLDVVVAAAVQGTSAALGGYQALLVLARVPVFVATALSIACYAPLSAEPGREAQRRLVSTSLRTYGLVAAVLLPVLALLPVGLLALVLPPEYLTHRDLLVPLTLAGLLAGAVNLLTTYYQATRRNRAVLPVLVLTAVLGPVLLAAASTSVFTLAWCSVLVLGGCVARLAWQVRRDWYTGTAAAAPQRVELTAGRSAD